ncbi:hypothetical protein HDU67_001480 [Dinochytrium kinnereticum]|nr:hypothetical protein HDU67_001480 [Dinochytrium kinnereticum]
MNVPAIDVEALTALDLTSLNLLDGSLSAVSPGDAFFGFDLDDAGMLEGALIVTELQDPPEGNPQLVKTMSDGSDDESNGSTAVGKEGLERLRDASISDQDPLVLDQHEVESGEYNTKLPQQPTPSSETRKASYAKSLVRHLIHKRNTSMSFFLKTLLGQTRLEKLGGDRFALFFAKVLSNSLVRCGRGFGAAVVLRVVLAVIMNLIKILTKK